MADTLSHAVGCGDRVATGHFADTKAGTREARHRGCECAANRTEPRTLWSVVAGAMAGRKRCAPRNTGSNGLRAATDFAQYLRWNRQRRPGAGRRRQRYGDDLLAAATKGRAAFGSERDSGW